MNKKIILLILAAFVGIGAGCLKKEADLPVFGTLPDFKLINQENIPVSRNDYAGKVWAVNFIFTSCGHTCPMLTKKMKQVQTAIQKSAQKEPGNGLAIVSFSVDPERDTPEKLKNYADAHGCDSKIWNFLTGPLEDITQTVVKGFKISMGKVPGAGVGEGEFLDVVHGEKFVLVDRKGQIRGYYSADFEGIEDLIQDMLRLGRQGT